LNKTFETSLALREHFQAGKNEWKNYILLLSSQKEDWFRVEQKNELDEDVQCITWEDVTVALRKSIQSNESIHWKTWAYSLIGAIEQNLLEIQYLHVEKQSPTHLQNRITILKKALNNEK